MRPVGVAADRLPAPRMHAGPADVLDLARAGARSRKPQAHPTAGGCPAAVCPIGSAGLDRAQVRSPHACPCLADPSLNLSLRPIVAGCPAPPLSPTHRCRLKVEQKGCPRSGMGPSRVSGQSRLYPRADSRLACGPGRRGVRQPGCVRPPSSFPHRASPGFASRCDRTRPAAATARPADSARVHARPARTQAVTDRRPGSCPAPGPGASLPAGRPPG